MTTPHTSGAADLLDLIEAYAEARHRQGHSSYNAQTSAALQAVKDALAAGQATAAQAGVPANMRLCYLCGHPADAHPWVNDPRGGKRRGDCPAAPAQPAAQQGVAYAALPDLSDADGEIWSAIIYWKHAKRGEDALRKASELERVLSDQMRAFADATHALRASHGQTSAYEADAAAPQPPTAPATQQAGEVRRAELVSGVMHCAKCKFQLNRVTLCVSDGNAYAGNNKTEPCPNGCGPLWPVTWEQEAKNCWKALEEMHERLMAAAAPQPSPTAQAADSVPAPPPPPECETEAEKRAFAFGWFKALESERMKADRVQEDAALWRWLAEYLVGTRTDLDDEIVACETVNDLRKLVESAIKQGEKQ